MGGREYEKKLDLIEFYRDSRNYENMRRACFAALKDSPHDQWALSMLALACYRLEDWDDFVRSCNTALAYQTPHQQAFIYNLLGCERSYRNDYEKAAEYIEKAVEGRPDEPEYMARYAIQLAHLGRESEAEDLLERAEAAAPNYFYVLMLKCDFYYHWCLDYKAEEEILTRMFPLSSGELYTMNYSIARFHQKYGDFQKAYDYYVKALLCKPGDEIAREMVESLKLRGYGWQGNIFQKAVMRVLAPKVMLNRLRALWFNVRPFCYITIFSLIYLFLRYYVRII